MKQTLAIVFLGDFFYDARCINMALSLKKKYRVSILCVYKTKLNHNCFNDISFYKIVLPRSGILKYWFFYKKTLKILNEKNYNIIIAGDLYSLAGACFTKGKKKLVYDCREIYSDLSAHIDKPIYRFLCSFYEKCLIKYFDEIIVTAKTDLEFLKKKYSRWTHLNWHIIYNYPFNVVLKKTNTLRTKYSIPFHHIIVVYQGVIHKGRGLSQLIKLTSLSSNINAFIVGEGNKKQHYKNYARSLNVSKKVVFIDKIPYLELLEFSSCCDIGWCVIDDSSLSYSFALPNKFFEYLLAGLPVIASPLKNLTHIMQKHNLGALVKYTDVLNQLKNIQFLAEHRHEKSYYNGIALRNFTWDVQKHTFLQIFKKGI